MFIDISFEFDCSYDEFIYDGVMKAEKGDRWISYHTEVGRYFLEYYGWYGDIHKRFKVSYDIYKKIYSDFNKLKCLSGSLGEFYWFDKEHTKHLGE